MEGASRVEELEDAKRKLSARVQEMEEALAAAESKASSMEKVKNRMNEEVEDLLLDLEKAQAQASNLEKKQKKFDQQINEWKIKCDEIQADLDKSQRDARAYSTELLKVRTASEDTIEKYDALKKENRALTGKPIYISLDYFKTLWNYSFWSAYGINSSFVFFLIFNFVFFNFHTYLSTLLNKQSNWYNQTLKFEAVATHKTTLIILTSL